MANYMVGSGVVVSIDGRGGTSHVHLLSLGRLADKTAFKAYLRPLREIDWVVYAKEPFAGSKQVLRYLSRYTHRIAISNRRLMSADHNGVTFKYKDYRIERPARYKTMTLTNDVSFAPCRIRFMSFPVQRYSSVMLRPSVQPSLLVNGEMRRRMQLLIPHVRRAVLVGRLLERRKSEAAAFADTFDRLSAGMFLVEATGYIVHSNAAGRALLSADDLLRAAGMSFTHRASPYRVSTGAPRPTDSTPSCSDAPFSVGCGASVITARWLRSRQPKTKMPNGPTASARASSESKVGSSTE